MITKIKEVLSDFAVHKIRYALLRNYEFLLDSQAEPGFDLDTVVMKDDFATLREILLRHGFVEYPQQFSLSHRGFGKYFAKEKVKFGLDIQVGGIHWNDMAYLDAGTAMARRVKKDFFYVLSHEDAFIMYVCHSLLGKRRFKEKYKQELVKLIRQNLDYGYVFNHLSCIFTPAIARTMIKKVQEEQFSYLERRAISYVGHYVLHKPRNVITFSLLFFRWLQWQRIGKSYPLISFIGPDGSGKSTAAGHILAVLNRNRRNAALVYMGRGKNNIIPIKFLAGKYKKYEDEKKKKNGKGTPLPASTFKQKLIYSTAAPLYTLDLLVRYFITIFPLRKSKLIVITDRYCSDILLMPHTPFWFKRFLLYFFPKPTLTFYLHNTAELLYERRKQQSVPELNRQMILFDYLSKKFAAVPVVTTSFEKNAAQIEEKIFEYFMKNRF